MLAFLLAVLFALPAHAQTFPKLAGEPVVDAANLLDPAQEAALNAKLKGIETATGHQVAVATVPSLEGRDIADYGYQLGRAWGIGKQGTNDGVVLIVAPNERRTRVEVGYGLEPVLTDAYSSVIVNSVMIPHFKSGDYPGGIDAGVDEIAKQIQLPPDQAAARAKAATDTARQSHGNGIPGGFIFWIFLFFFVVLPLLRGLGGRRYGGGGSGIGNVILWSALNAASSGRDSGSGWGGGGGDGGGFSGGGGSFGGGGASGGW